MSNRTEGGKQDVKGWDGGSTEIGSGNSGRPSDKSRRLRIAMISYYLPSESKIGVGYWVDQLAREMVRRGHRVTVFSACRAVESSPYEVKTVKLSGSFRTFRFAWELRHAPLAQFDVLHAHGDDYWLWRRRAAVHIRTLHGSCFSEAIHITGGRDRLRMFGLGLGEALATVVADKTVAISPGTRLWTPWVREVLADGPDVERFRRSPQREREQCPTVLFVGTYHRRKRGALLVEAFRRDVLPAIPEAQLWMVSEDCPPFERVVPLGRVSDDRLVDLYQRAWVFCLPSSYEGLGIPYIEAMAAGLPVVATPNPGSRFVLGQGRYGLLTTEAQLGATLASLLRNSVERERLSSLGLERSAVLSLARAADRYEDIYYELLGPLCHKRWQVA